MSLAKFRLRRGPGPLPPFGYANAPLRKTKKVFTNFPRSFLCFTTKFQRFKKIVLFSSRGQGNFLGPKASRPRPRTSNVSLRTSSGPRTSSKTPPLVSNLFFLMQNKVLSKLIIFFLFAVIYAVNKRTPARYSSQVSKQQKSWSSWSGPMFSFMMSKAINTETHLGYTERLGKPQHGNGS